MAPRKRKTGASQEEEPVKTEPTAPALSGRVTRDSTRLATAKSVESAKPKKQPAKKKVKTTKAKEEEKVETEIVYGDDVTAEEEEKVTELVENETDGDGDDVSEKKKTIVVEHCKQCNSFKTRANLVKDGLEKGVPGITVLLNPEKPRRGCFEIREEGGKAFTSLLGMKRPFKPMKDLDMDKVIADIISEVK